MRVTEEQVLMKLRQRLGRGGVRLSYAEAEWLLERLGNPPLTRESLKVLVDQAKRKRLLERGSVFPKGSRPSKPVIDVSLKEREAVPA